MQRIEDNDYLELLRLAIQGGVADMIDVEVSHGEEIIDEIIRTAHRAKKMVLF